MPDDDWGVYYTSDGVPYYYNKRTQETSWDKPDSLKSAEELDQKGDWVWVPHQSEGFVIAQVGTKYTNGDTQCTTEDRKVIQVPKNVPLIPVVKSSLQRINEDLVQMDDMNEPLVIHNLRERFKKNLIYTHVGTILISVNPFKPLPLYTPTIIDEYAHKGTKELPPHVFNISSAAYNNLISDKTNQSILISGESGAGKTEATKVVLQYLAEVAGSTSGVEENILLANPILEAFGNAKTLRNNNSSRFGKWVEIHFDKQGRICGAKTVNYLLEKTRVVNQTQGERNYHIFYQLCMGASDKLRKQFSLGMPDDYKILNQSGCTTIEGTDDLADFQEVEKAMKKIKFTEAERDAVFQIIAAILHLGNINYIPVTIKYNNADVQAAEIDNPAVLEKAASLLGVAAADLKKAICFRRMTIKGQAPTDIPLDNIKARDNCNALAKTVYGVLFDWLVKRINMSMAPPANSQTNIIGVLDIFGFEIFETNSFEQLCINFANEKLQQHFNQHTFKLEEQVYQEEKIPYTHVDFIDNQPCLDLIEAKPLGVLCMLDEEIVLPRTTDDTFLQKLHQTHEKKHEKYVKPVKLRNSFIIKHYAGDVTYSVENFLEKNKDILNEDLVLVIETSKIPLLNDLFPKGQTLNRKSSLGNQFRGQLAALMTTLQATTPHYIRCVKPNPFKAAGTFDGTMVLQQLRYAGVFEAIHIRKTGYPFRRLHQEFYKRYRLLTKGLKGNDFKSLCATLIATLPGDLKKELHIGVSKVLYKAGPHRKLELLRSVETEKAVIKLQSGFRGWQSRKISKELKRCKPILLAAIKARTLPAVEDALKKSENCRFEYKPLKDARRLKEVLLEEKRITEQIQVLLKQDHDKAYDAMVELLKKAKAIDMKTADVTQLDSIVTQITERRKIRADLANGTEKFDRTLLADALQKIKEVGLTEESPEVKKAREALKRITEEEKIVAELKRGTESGACENMDHSTIEYNTLEAALKKANSFVCKTEEGKALVAKGAILLEIRKALVAEQYPDVSALLMKAQKAGIDNDEIKAAREEVAYLTAVEELTQRIWDAIQARDEETLKFGLEQATTLGVQDQEVPAQGQVILTQIQEARRWLQSGLHYVDQDHLQTGVDLSAAFQYDTEEVRAAQTLLAQVIQYKSDAQESLAVLDRERMERTLENSRAINLQTEDVNQLIELLENTAMDKFLQMQLKVATKMNDRARVVKVTIQIKDSFFAQFEHIFVWNKYMKFRPSDQYASAKLMGNKDQLRSGMLLWSKKAIPTSLTNLESHQVKIAVRFFKNIQGYMGDKQMAYPETLAADLVENAKPSKELADEAYCQILKQLTSNPSRESVAKGWDLLTFCLKRLAPSDDFSNYLEIFLRKQAPADRKQAMIYSLHEVLYSSEPSKAPAAQQVRPSDDPAVNNIPPPSFPKSPSLGNASRLSVQQPAQTLQRPQSNKAIPQQYQQQQQAQAQFIPPPPAASHAPAEQYMPPPPPPLNLPPPPPADPIAVGMYDYTASGPGQLSFRRGDRILIMAKDASGWWTGELNGVLGHFPSNYTEELK